MWMFAYNESEVFGFANIKTLANKLNLLVLANLLLANNLCSYIKLMYSIF